MSEIELKSLMVMGEGNQVLGRSDYAYVVDNGWVNLFANGLFDRLELVFMRSDGVRGVMPLSIDVNSKCMVSGGRFYIYSSWLKWSPQLWISTIEEQMENLRV